MQANGLRAIKIAHFEKNKSQLEFGSKKSTDNRISGTAMLTLGLKGEER
jgi:hypothetical protein